MHAHYRVIVQYCTCTLNPYASYVKLFESMNLLPSLSSHYLINTPAPSPTCVCNITIIIYRRLFSDAINEMINLMCACARCLPSTTIRQCSLFRQSLLYF